jgi:hypothetical protein
MSKDWHGRLSSRFLVQENDNMFILSEMSLTAKALYTDQH